ncbi:uncharacterized protein LOC106150828 [Lingula anatina]|uniref:Uncharacterized protein LOC106150828 n=1 Tax=Lingula anatina TaxID=7574 RepID=A0A1S3GZV6_LINAN|nr:uncharacterized protein LOC106150828 [Lingula anatina]|eukprot:XP_013379283.1 uncharacterized protein LOC106150828 [Lingula anatina]
MGIDMSRPASSSQQICQEGHLLIHMKMDVITREDGQQTLTLRCFLCDSVLRMSGFSRSEFINHPVVTAVGQTLQNGQKANQADTNPTERESKFDDFAHNFIKTDSDLTCEDCEGSIGLDMQVESYESGQFDLAKHNQGNIATVSDLLKNPNQIAPLANHTAKAGISSVPQTFSAQRGFSAPSGVRKPTCKFCNATEGEFEQGLIWGHNCKKLEGNIFICCVCNEYYDSCNLVTECERKHRLIKNSYNKEEFKCMVCSIKFADLRETKRHELCHNSNDSEVHFGISVQPELNSDSKSQGPESENQQTQKLPSMASSTPSNNIQVPHHENLSLTVGTQILPPIISPQDLQHIKFKSQKPEQFCVALMAKIFSNAERLQNDTNILGTFNKKKFCPVRIQFIKDCVHQNYPQHFQNEMCRWRKCVGAMNSANRSLRFYNATKS